MSGIFETCTLSDGRTVRTLSGTGTMRTLEASDGTTVTAPAYATRSQFGLDDAFGIDRYAIMQPVARPSAAASRRSRKRK